MTMPSGRPAPASPAPASPAPKSPAPATYAAFWPVYLAAHRKRATRLWHFLGTCAGFALVILAAAFADWRLLVAAPLVGYAPAWLSHFLVEGNRPATFGHPLWSFASDLRMLGLWLAGRLEGEYRRHAIETS